MDRNVEQFMESFYRKTTTGSTIAPAQYWGNIKIWALGSKMLQETIEHAERKS